jgi:hypothetical protein
MRQAQTEKAHNNRFNTDRLFRCRSKAGRLSGALDHLIGCTMTQIFKDASDQTFSAIDGLPGSSWAVLAEPIASGSIHRLKMIAGSTIPAHTHPADEYVVLLSGELVTGGRKCSAGCFCLTPANTRQGPHEALTDVELVTIRLGAIGDFEK